MQARIKNLLTNNKLYGAEIFVLIVLFVFGLAACFLLPLSSGYDEETHLIRAWQISDFQFLPNENTNGKTPFPAIYYELSYRRQVIVRAVEPGFCTKYIDLAIDAHDYFYDNVETRSVYSPLLLLTQAIVLRWRRTLDPNCFRGANEIEK